MSGWGWGVGGAVDVEGPNAEVYKLTVHFSPAAIR